MSPRARQAKNKARISAYEQLAAEQFEDRTEELEIQIPPGKHLGEVVVHATDLSKGFGDKLLIDNSPSACRQGASSVSLVPRGW